MKIKNISGILNVYSKAKASSGKAVTAPTEKKTDKIEFDFARSVNAAKADLSASINESADAKQIDRLRRAVEDGSYYVSADDVAQAILTF